MLTENNMKQRILLFITCICFIICGIKAQSRDAVKTSTDILMFAPPVAGFITPLALGDYNGTKQLVVGAATSLATSYILRSSLKTPRHVGSYFHSLT